MLATDFRNILANFCHQHTVCHIVCDTHYTVTVASIGKSFFVSSRRGRRRNRSYGRALQADGFDRRKTKRQWYGPKWSMILKRTRFTVIRSDIFRLIFTISVLFFCFQVEPFFQLANHWTGTVNQLERPYVSNQQMFRNRLIADVATEHALI